MIKVDIRSKNSAYITIGKWVIYVDDSTGEQIIDSWKEWNTNSKSKRKIKRSKRKKNEKKLQAPSTKLRHFVARHYVALTQYVVVRQYVILTEAPSSKLQAPSYKPQASSHP